VRQTDEWLVRDRLPDVSLNHEEDFVRASKQRGQQLRDTMSSKGKTIASYEPRNPRMKTKAILKPVFDGPACCCCIGFIIELTPCGGAEGSILFILVQCEPTLLVARMKISNQPIKEIKTN